MHPSFTIAIPVYERLFGFEEALDSALAVNGCTEVLVADNHSSHDEFQTICRAKGDGRIRYVKHEKNYGIYGNQNRCAELATGDFMAILGSDDIIAPDIYDRFLKAYEAMPDLDIFFGPFTCYMASLEDAWSERPYPEGPVSSQRLLEDAVDFGMRFPVLFVARREKMLCFPFVTEPHSSNDLLWIYSNASKLKLYAHPDPISYWRKYPEQDSTVYLNQMYDVFPFLYVNIAEQLENMNSPKVENAYRRAYRVIMALLINEKVKNSYWRNRLLQENANQFVVKAKQLADKKWLIRRLLYTKRGWPLYYNLGRAYRKLKPIEGI
ncbi:MAG: glycosyltransferase family 2 protein [Chitinophagaceae bacterium]|nr:MAG: glycosyltransferase family 2 protein [Chitinophagaceae bacterium]